MVKNGPSLTPCYKRWWIFSISFIIFTSCSTSPTYQRKDIEKVIKNICKEEFNLEVNVWEVGDTLWIYSPFEKILDENRQINKDISEDMRRIFLSLRRVILSIDKPPKFYCLIFSDIKEIGLDLYYIGFIPDLVKFEMNFISIRDMQEREVFLPLPNHKALGDKEGKHLLKYDITMEEFISYLVKQQIERKFTAPEIKDNFKINDLRTYYYQGTLGVIFDIAIKEGGEKILYPFKEIKEIIKKYLNIYSSWENIVSIEINDTLNKKRRFYTKKAILK
jgi:hypothetical protein